MSDLRTAVFGIIYAVLASGCVVQPNASSLNVKYLRSVDGLEVAEIPLTGTLELRENHGIGGYDMLMVPDASITFRRESQRLTTPARRIFLKMLRESLVDAIEAANIPVVDKPGQCVMEINLAAIGMNLSTDRSANQLARLTMVMQFRDSESGEPLLRYSTDRLIETPVGGVTHDAKLRAGLDEIIKDLDLAGSLRGAGLGDDSGRPGCESTLGRIGRRAQG